MSASLLLAYAVDMMAGEPPEAWHPVCWMGRAVKAADRMAPGRNGGPGPARLAGAAVALGFPVGVYVVTGWLLRLLPRPFSGITGTALLWVSLAGRSLYDGAEDVRDGLAVGIDDARGAASRMVGRDTAALDEAGVSRAAVESVAENANDGVIAPMFYGLVGGAPLALAYKMINTLDSMIGYRSHSYSDFGWAAARLDDAAGFVPARLTALAVMAASPVSGGSAANALKVWRRDSGAHESPNAGVCEGAFAGSLGVRLGGTSHYGGVAEAGPVLGKEFRAPERDDIRRAANLMVAAATLFLAAGVLGRRLVNCARSG